MNPEYKIADCWLPTFENVTKEFITNNLYKILFNDKLPNFKFDFKEPEAIEFIKQILDQYSNKYEFYKIFSDKILQELKNPYSEDSTSPVMVIKDYKQFFESLRYIYEKNIDIYFLKHKDTYFPRYEKDNLFEQLWLRATPDDFNNPELFLEKQALMLKDTTFDKYNNENFIGKIDSLDNNILCIQNNYARTWDENFKEIKITIYDKKFYNNQNLFYKPNYALPVIRYGIYEKDGKKICHIGSIQNKQSAQDKSSNLTPQIDIIRKNLNAEAGKKESYKYKIEANKIIALSIFINLLNKENIYDIEIPSMYVLDYEYHKKRGIAIKKQFEKLKSENISSQRYEWEKAYFEKNYKKEDFISFLKTENLMYHFMRILEHYPKGKINSYPEELDNYFHITIPKIESKDDITGNILKEFFSMLNEKSLDVEK